MSATFSILFRNAEHKRKVTKVTTKALVGLDFAKCRAEPRFCLFNSAANSCFESGCCGGSGTTAASTSSAAGGPAPSFCFMSSSSLEAKSQSEWQRAGCSSATGAGESPSMIASQRGKLRCNTLCKVNKEWPWKHSRDDIQRCLGMAGMALGNMARPTFLAHSRLSKSAGWDVYT